jgi:hypothetical protein
MTDLTVIDKGNHCEIHQGDAIAADYVASVRLANLFAAAPELLYQLKHAIRLLVEAGYPETYGRWQEFDMAVNMAEGRE